jgi:predicted Kef-type K+ transport protein
MDTNIDLFLTLTAGRYPGPGECHGPVGSRLAGVVVGPNTPSLIADRQQAEVGLIQRIFGAGLRFHSKELLAVRRIAVPGAVAHSPVVRRSPAFRSAR